LAQFETFEVSIQLIESLKGLTQGIAQHDRDLASQLRRAASRISLNLSEGSLRVGKDRLHCFRIAAGSAAETRAALRVAQSWGYTSADSSSQALKLVDRVSTMLWRLTHPR
jgi:four helix bundle protein